MREERTERDPENLRDSHQGVGREAAGPPGEGQREQETDNDTEVPGAKSEVLPDPRSTSGKWSSEPYKRVGAGGGPWERSGQGAGKGGPKTPRPVSRNG